MARALPAWRGAGTGDGKWQAILSTEMLKSEKTLPPPPHTHTRGNCCAFAAYLLAWHQGQLDDNDVLRKD